MWSAVSSSCVRDLRGVRRGLLLILWLTLHLMLAFLSWSLRICCLANRCGLPWIPPCYAWGIQAPIQPLRHQFPSSSIGDEFKGNIVMSDLSSAFSSQKVKHLLYCILKKIFTVEPPISDHPKCKDLVVAYGRWLLTRIKPHGVPFEKSSLHIYFLEENYYYCMQFLSYLGVVPCCH